MIKLETRNFTDCVSYDETETEVDDYLPDDTLIPVETDSSEADNFKDKNTNCVDVKKIKDTLVKLADSFHSLAEAYTELEDHLPNIPAADVTPLVSTLPSPDNPQQGPLARAIEFHGEEYIIVLIIRKQLKEGCTTSDLQCRYQITRYTFLRLFMDVSTKESPITKGRPRK